MRVVVTACLFLTGCMVQVHGVGAGPGGEVYLAARRSFLGFPGPMHVLQCVDGLQDLSCRRLASGSQLHKAIARSAPSRASDDRLPAPRDRPSTDRSDLVEGTFDLDEAPAEIDPAAVLASVYTVVGRRPDDPAARQRDEAAIRSLLVRGRSPTDVVRSLKAAAAADADATVATLAAALIRGTSLQDLSFEAE